MSTQLRKEHGKDEANKKALQVGSLVGLVVRNPNLFCMHTIATKMLTNLHSSVAVLSGPLLYGPRHEKT